MTAAQPKPSKRPGGVRHLPGCLLSPSHAGECKCLDARSTAPSVEEAVRKARLADMRRLRARVEAAPWSNNHAMHLLHEIEAIERECSPVTRTEQGREGENP